MDYYSVQFLLLLQYMDYCYLLFVFATATVIWIIATYYLFLLLLQLYGLLLLLQLYGLLLLAICFATIQFSCCYFLDMDLCKWMLPRFLSNGFMDFCIDCLMLKHVWTRFVQTGTGERERKFNRQQYPCLCYTYYSYYSIYYLGQFRLYS